jgi:hypothetical protein
MTDLTHGFARIHVRSGEDGHAWPVVERVAGGWQSGAHHYPDAEVLDVRQLPLAHNTVDPVGPNLSVQTRAAQVMLQHWLNSDDLDADRHAACICGRWREGEPSVCPGWDDHLAEVLDEAGLLRDPDF